MSFWRHRDENRVGELLSELQTVVPGSKRFGSIVGQLAILGVQVERLKEPSPPYVTVAECGHCFEDLGERA